MSDLDNEIKTAAFESKALVESLRVRVNSLDDNIGKALARILERLDVLERTFNEVSKERDELRDKLKIQTDTTISLMETIEKANTKYSYNWSSDLDALSDQISKWRQAKGFDCPNGIDTAEKRTAMMEKLMLVVTEVGEAAEAVRHVDEDNFREELADAVIRVLDISGTGDWSLLEAIHKKMTVNVNRPYKHGKEL